MASCCHADEYSSLFGGGEATRRAWLFRHVGLHGSARRAAEFAANAGDGDATLLEVGGGLGEIQVALLEQDRVATATSVDLSTGWEDRAVELLVERGLADRVERRVGDVVDDVEDLPVADLVVAHRVLCCYPHWQRMVDALLALTRRRLVVTLPVDRRRTRAFIGIGNRFMARSGRAFRAFVHPVDDVLAHAAAAGFVVVDDDAGLAWRTIALEPRGT
ncbi:class I SAM-dependent methyltransferase [Salsipaludibacter albus]|uniref:class I SAM-dependent methyltransferase n=1 Tax=Salsipaludibacter albus TaxID=2849650 RepID=UPI001EE4AC1A|nr:class I SAM-dependent methyltransferase [Salsipaludibacter albus]